MSSYNEDVEDDEDEFDEDDFTNDDDLADIQDTVNQVIGSMETHAKNAGYSSVASYINHHIISFQVIKEIDPQVAAKLNQAMVLRATENITRKEFRNQLHSIGIELEHANQYFTGQLRLS